MTVKSNPTKSILTITVGFLLVFVISEYEYRWALMTAISVGLAGVISEYLALKIEWLWFKLAKLLSYIVPNILLSIVFYFFLFPIALLSKVVSRKNLLQLRKEGNTNWVTVNKQFVKKDLENPW
jgi:hypothetical protein